MSSIFDKILDGEFSRGDIVDVSIPKSYGHVGGGFYEIRGIVYFANQDRMNMLLVADRKVSGQGKFRGFRLSEGDYVREEFFYADTRIRRPDEGWILGRRRYHELLEEMKQNA